mmetsp:Transcript_10432/g.18780  ORF Transcript_10432/g.18780 Transcript_10432/m.18780 type:complete len:504 (+) Transcript_10432:118-1629(+)
MGHIDDELMMRMNITINAEKACAQDECHQFGCLDTISMLLAAMLLFFMHAGFSLLEPHYPHNARDHWTSMVAMTAKFEDFEIGRAVGSGEFGKVFQVMHRSTQQVFAMKRLSKVQYAKKGMMEKALREIAVLRAAGGHPFVVRLVHAIENSREWALVMELCPGGDLQQLLLKEGCPGLQLDQTLKLTAEVALALEHLHSRRIVFRDLKLENVVVSAEGHAKLTDFGLAKQQHLVQDDEGRSSLDNYAAFTKTFCGSYGYAAPEVNPRREVHGCSADMYSFGVLLFMLLVGGEVVHLREAPWERRVPPETPGDLKAVVDRLGFDFYWTAHHLLRPSGSSHRVEVDLSGQVVVTSRGGGPQGIRRQRRPPRPPTSLMSPEMRDDDDVFDEVQPSFSRPQGFPDPECAEEDEALEHRQWTSAMDLIQILTDEQPQARGTASRLREHPFYADKITDWQTIFPQDSHGPHQDSLQQARPERGELLHLPQDRGQPANHEFEWFEHYQVP